MCVQLHMAFFVVGILVNFLSGGKAYRLVSCECTKIFIMSTVACESSTHNNAIWTKHKLSLHFFNKYG